MDYKGFKKVHEDEEKAILKNKHGHSITISKKALSPKHREGISRLPLHAAGGTTNPIPPKDDPQGMRRAAEIDRMEAEKTAQYDENARQNQPKYLVDNTPGTDARPAPVQIFVGGNQPQSPRAPTNEDYATPPPPMQSEPTGENPNTGTPLANAAAAEAAAASAPYNGPTDTLATQPSRPKQAAIVPPAAQEPIQPQQQAPEPQAAAPAPNPVQQDYQEAYNNYQALHARDFGEQAAAYQNDLDNGHVTPATYSQLFADKSTLGKIGTLFGLLISGAGSGITGQPNAVLQMMTKEVENDLDAQKASKVNAQNFLRINQEAALNQARINQMQREGLLTEARTKTVPLEGALTQAKIKNMPAEAELMRAQAKNALADASLKAQTWAKTNMFLSGVNYLEGMTNTLPQGPHKDNVIQMLQGVKQGANQQIGNDINKASSALAKSNTEAQYVAGTRFYRNMEMAGQEGAGNMATNREQHYIPGIGTTTRPINDEGIKRITQINNFQNLLQEATELNDVLGRRGAWTPSEKLRAARIHSDLVSSYNDVKGLMRFTGNEEKLYNKIIPDVGVVNITGAQRDLLDDVKKSVQTKKDLEYKTFGVRPFSDSQDHRQESSQAKSSDTVRVTSPDGQLFHMPRSNLKKALSRGFKESR